jgi:hypothetical protein
MACKVEKIIVEAHPGSSRRDQESNREAIQTTCPRFRKRVAVSYTVSFILVRKIKAEISINAATLAVENEAYPC